MDEIRVIGWDNGTGDRTIFMWAEMLSEVQRKIDEAFCIPPRIIYHKFKPYLIVDNTKPPCRTPRWNP